MTSLYYETRVWNSSSSSRSDLGRAVGPLGMMGLKIATFEKPEWIRRFPLFLLSIEFLGLGSSLSWDQTKIEYALELKF